MNEPPSPPRSPRFSARIVVLLVAALVAAFALVIRSRDAGPLAPSASAAGPRIVSLAPAVTETLFAIGAGDMVVGVSNYCRHPKQVERLPRTGSAITPAYEAIARLQPTLIVASEVGGEQLVPLSRMAKTERLPWLALDEVVASTARLGELVGRAEAGKRLSQRLEETLSVQPKADAPRVLLTMSYGDGASSDVWFIRDNSLHGAALRAAGAQNAVSSAVKGQPRLSLEELVRLDPDIVILLVDTEQTGTVDVDRFRRITPLRAVRNGSVGVLRVAGALDGGPRVLDLVAPLRAEIARLDAL